jgi:hypothetical protein
MRRRSPLLWPRPAGGRGGLHPYVLHDDETQAPALPLRDSRVPGPPSRTGGRGRDSVCLDDAGDGNDLDGGLSAARGRNSGLSERLPEYGGLLGQHLFGESNRRNWVGSSDGHRRHDRAGRRRISRSFGKRATRTTSPRLSSSPAVPWPVIAAGANDHAVNSVTLRAEVRVRLQMMNSGAVK